jgi:short-subunit dehydrogenase
MLRKLQDSVVVIVGASSGIGRATALEFAGKGATVVVAARREEALREVVRECEQRGTRALAVPTDVTKEGEVQALARRAIESYGRIDVWVNNAAVSLFGRFEETPPEDYRRVIETNLFGFIHGARAVLPHFREQGSGVLINVASIVGKTGQPYASAYVASKSAVIGFSTSLRQELRDEKDIHVCTVFPASIDTPLFQQAGNYTGRAAKAMNPVNEPEKVGRAIVSAAMHPKREVVSGIGGRMMLTQWRLTPGLAERVMGIMVERGHFQDIPTPPTQGNLYEPMPEWARLSGGWREQASTQVTAHLPRVATVAMATLGPALLGWFVLRPHLGTIAKQFMAVSLIRRIF